MKSAVLFISLVLSIQSISQARDVVRVEETKPCTPKSESKIQVVNLSDGTTGIRTVSPLGRPRILVLGRDLMYDAESGSYKNDFIQAVVANGKVQSVEVSNQTALFSCE